MRWLMGVTASVILMGVSGVTASNAVTPTKAGNGSGAITGFVVSGISYNLNANSPNNINSVTFTLDSAPPAGSTMRIRLTSAPGSWYACSNAGVAVTCATTVPQATVTATDTLRVVIAQ